MADRVTQLQDKLHEQANNFCNSVGILQQFASPSGVSAVNRPKAQDAHLEEDYPKLFATLISRCAKDIDALIDSLPSDESTLELQIESLKYLEDENVKAAEQLEEIVQRGEFLLDKIQSALSDIAQTQLEAKKLDTKELSVSQSELDSYRSDIGFQ